MTEYSICKNCNGFSAVIYSSASGLDHIIEKHGFCKCGNFKPKKRSWFGSCKTCGCEYE